MNNIMIPAGGGGGGTWGSITGTLSNQTDLSTALALKANLASPTFTGTVTAPSGSITSSAWDTGTSSFTSNGVAFTSKLTKAASSTNFSIPTWSGAAGDTLVSNPKFTYDAANDFFNFYAFGAGLCPIVSYHAARGTQASPTVCQSGDQLVEVSMLGTKVNGAGNEAYAAVFRAFTTETWTNTAQGTKIDLQTVTTGTTTRAVRFLIDGNGDTNILNGKLLCASLGVGNSAAATIAVGTLTKKIQVYDASGVSIGYVPVYDAIT